MPEIAQSTSREVTYLLPTPTSFWRWTSDGKWIEWNDNRTILHRDQLATVIERLAPRGLPPLDAILLLLSACRSSWNADTAKQLITAGATRETQVEGMGLISSVIAKRLDQTLTDVLSDLAAITDLPANLRDSAAAQASLAEFVFDGAVAAVDSAVAAQVAALLRAGVDGETLRRVRLTRDLVDELPEVLESLQSGLGRVAVEPVATWLKTGVVAPVQPADIDVPLPQRVRELVGQLQEDRELGGLASVAKDLLAALHVPRRLVSREDLPLGGVSDISNRGPLDRLLVSELANDELTLAIRVALGEAMYLRREAPAHHPKTARHLLIDCGIRLWGIPRLFATAVGLALAAASDVQSTVHVHRTAGPTFIPSDFTTRQGILDHLGALRPEPEPLPALRLLMQAAAEQQSEETEVFLVTHEDAFADVHTAVTRETGGLAELTVFVATVTREGQVVLWRLSAAGRQEISRLQLSVDKLFPPNKNEQIELLTRDARFPMILRRESLPLRLPSSINPRQAVRLPSVGMAAVTSDHRLAAWTDRNRGGLQLTDALPTGNIEAVLGDIDPPVVHVVSYAKKTNTLTVLSSNLEGPCRRRSIRRNRPQAVVLHQRRLLLMYHNEVRVFDPETGDESSYPLRNNEYHHRGRFYYARDTRWFAAGLSGLEPVCPIRTDTLTPFDRPGLGPWLLLKDFTVTPADRSVLARGFDPAVAGTAPPSVVRVITPSADGNHLVVEGKQAPNSRVSWWHFDLIRWTMSHSTSAHAVFEATVGEFGKQSVTSGLNLRRTFEEIGRDRQGRVTLVRKGELFTLMANARHDLIWANTGQFNDTCGVTHRQDFNTVQSPDGTRYKLRKASWRDGSEAWLDSRGMLHLVSSDRQIPQITLTLGDQPAAAWTSDGQTAGWKYFVDDSSEGVASAIEQMSCNFAGKLTT